MDKVIADIYNSGFVIGLSGKKHQLHSAIDQKEGQFLSSIIQADPAIRNTLEVGCAYGLSSLFIASAIRGRPSAAHTIIDPFQRSQWDGVGIQNLKAAGIDFYQLIEANSELALPGLLEAHEGQFDFIFVDGWHTFDHTLLDCFYATRLLRVGGVLAIDDVGYPSVKRVVNFLKNYPCYEQVGSVGEKISTSWKKSLVRSMMSPIKKKTWENILSSRLYRSVFDDQRARMVALRKVQEDRRNWDWHEDMF
jgi:predicted O-methyltransferase YrrM